MPRITVASIDLASNILTTSAAHGFTTGWAVGVIVSRQTNGEVGIMPASSPAIAATGVYFVRNISSTTLSLHTSNAAAVAGTGAIDFTGQTLYGSVLSLFRLSVRERIERCAAAIIAATPGVDQCQRWDARGNPMSIGGEVDAAVVVFNETATDEPIGNPGQTNKTMTLAILAVLRQSETDAENTSSFISRTLADLEATITADPKLREASPSGTRLASDLTMVGIQRHPITEEQPEIMVQIEVSVMYCHPRNDPYSLTWPEN